MPDSGDTNVLHAATVGIIRAFFKLATLILVVGGFASLVAWMAARSVISTTSSELQGAGAVIRNIGLTHLLCGMCALYLLREKPSPDAGGQAKPATPVAGGTPHEPIWHLVLGLFLVMLPIILIVEARPLIAFWTQTHQELAREGLYQQLSRSPEDALLGLLLMIGFLIVPVTASTSALTLIVSSALLLGLWLWRSSFFPRAFAICVVFQFAWLLSTVFATPLDIPHTLGEEWARGMEASPPDAEAARMVTEFRQWLALYDNAVAGFPPRLIAACGAFALWLPFVWPEARDARIFTRKAPRGGMVLAANPGILVLSNPRPMQAKPIVITRIHFEGKQYDSPAVMPADVRQRWERVVKRLGEDAAATTIVEFRHNGRLYTSLDDMPPDVRRAYEDIVRTLS